MGEKEKCCGNLTPEQLADKEVNKILGKAIAERKLKIKEHQADIKKLEKEIQQIINGELVPADSSTTHNNHNWLRTSVSNTTSGPLFPNILPTPRPRNDFFKRLS